MYKSLGGYSWSWASKLSADECSIDSVESAASETLAQSLGEEAEASIIQVAQDFHLSLQNLKQVFTEEVYRGIFGFATWWSCFVWFASSSLGMFYQTYFTNKT